MKPTLEHISDERPNLEDLQQKVGGYIEVLSLGDGSQLVVNEDGYPKGLPVNDEAATLVAKHGANPAPRYDIVGNAVVLSGDAKLS